MFSGEEYDFPEELQNKLDDLIVTANMLGYKVSTGLTPYADGFTNLEIMVDTGKQIFEREEVLDPFPTHDWFKLIIVYNRGLPRGVHRVYLTRFLSRFLCDESNILDKRRWWSGDYYQTVKKKKHRIEFTYEAFDILKDILVGAADL